ncbi:hypothetical protein [Nannocystis pusilla]|uniref:hypothetical protein n=1 Tax=Nannocystis pusilla TaxID=889268 RepID=UPI003BF17B48
MAGLGERDTAERVRRAIADGGRPLELWADARSRGEVEVGLVVAATLIDGREVADAGRVLDELGPLAGDGHRDVLVLLRQRLRHAHEQPLDLPALAAALDGLLAQARWEDALDAASLLAGESEGDLAAIRRYRTIAVGAAEAGGARYLGAVQLRLLAAAELAAGDGGRCLAHVEQALRRLEGVPLLGARLEVGRCHELAGDAHVAGCSFDLARQAYDRASDRFAHADFGASHRERVREKRDALG